MSIKVILLKDQLCRYIDEGLKLDNYTFSINEHVKVTDLNINNHSWIMSNS